MVKGFVQKSKSITSQKNFSIPFDSSLRTRRYSQSEFRNIVFERKKVGRPRKNSTTFGIDDQQLFSLLGVAKEEHIRGNFIRRLIRKIKTKTTGKDVKDKKLTNLNPVLGKLNDFLGDHIHCVSRECSDWESTFRQGKAYQQPNLYEHMQFLNYKHLRIAYDLFAEGIIELDFEVVKNEFKLKTNWNKHEVVTLLREFISSETFLKTKYKKSFKSSSMENFSRYHLKELEKLPQTDNDYFEQLALTFEFCTFNQLNASEYSPCEFPLSLNKTSSHLKHQSFFENCQYDSMKMP